MKRFIAILLSAMLFVLFGACSKEETETKKERRMTEATTVAETSSNAVTIKPSPDKYTWYIKNYVGKNCAMLGYTSISEDRFDRYGEALLKLIFVSSDGNFVDITSDESLKEWVVIGQDIEPNTELKLVFQKDSNGEEYSNLIDSQTYEEIVLTVKKVGSSDNGSKTFVKINASPDKYTWYIRDYVGRNLASCGYVSMGGDFRAAYGDATIKFVIVTEDGTFVDPEDAVALQSYVVTGQNIQPNTKLDLVYMKDSDGEEYSNLIESQNIEEIELYVKKIT